MAIPPLGRRGRSGTAGRAPSPASPATSRRRAAPAPLTDDQIADKFKELVVPVTGEAAARELLDACWSLETLGSVRDLPFRIGRAAQAAE
jgi:hypothetical protein